MHALPQLRRDEIDDHEVLDVSDGIDFLSVVDTYALCW